MARNHQGRLAVLPLALALAAALSLPWLGGCSKWDVLNIARAAASGNPTGAFTSLARSKAWGYAANPLALEADIKRFIRAVGSLWGDDAKAPTPKQYVKYTQDYRARALVDFDSGLVTVETVDTDNTLESLRQAVVTTLLTPADPRAVDLYSAGAVTLGGTPFLLGEVKDFQGRDIVDHASADSFAQELILTRLVQRSVEGRIIWSVSMPMVPDHLHVRAAKYADLVRDNAARFGISQSLIFAVMEVESDFNPFAVSWAGAMGLMQVVPTTAGADVCNLLNGHSCLPEADSLFPAATNITYGTAYLHLLQTRYFGGVADTASRDMLMIAGYNGGPWAVSGVFANSKGQALAVINRLRPAGVYQALHTNLPAEETRDYLDKVLLARKRYVNFD